MTPLGHPELAASAISTQSLGGLTSARSSRNPSQPRSGKSPRRQDVRCSHLRTCDHSSTTWGLEMREAEPYHSHLPKHREETTTKGDPGAQSPGGLWLGSYLPAWTVRYTYLGSNPTRPSTDSMPLPPSPIFLGQKQS